jgi:hypothetical protein
MRYALLVNDIIRPFAQSATETPHSRWSESLSHGNYVDSLYIVPYCILYIRPCD